METKELTAKQKEVIMRALDIHFGDLQKYTIGRPESEQAEWSLYLTDVLEASELMSKVKTLSY